MDIKKLVKVKKLIKVKRLVKAFLEKEKLKQTVEKNCLHHIDLKGVKLELVEIVETIKNYKTNSNILLDIGANKGLFSKVANAFFYFDKTICFEPNEKLNSLIEENNKNNNLVIENIALADHEDEVIYFLHQDEAMNSIVKANNTILKEEFPWDNPDAMRETTVKTITLDDYIERNQLINEKFLIKIDTQGSELNILKHGIKTLKNTEICLIEYMFLSPYQSDYSFYDLLRFMDENAFDCKGALTISKRPSKKISAVDFLFVKRKELLPSEILYQRVHEVLPL